MSSVMNRKSSMFLALLLAVACGFARSQPAPIPIPGRGETEEPVIIPQGPSPTGLIPGTRPPALIDEEPERLRHELPISGVVVYEDRALVTRRGELIVRGGIETILVAGLPPALIETSLRAGLEGDVPGRVISVSSEVERRREIQDETLRKVEGERRAVERKIAGVDDELARISLRESYLNSYEKLTRNAISQRTGGGQDPQTARWGEALKFVREGRSLAMEQRRQARERRAVLERELGDLQAEAKRLRRPAERSTRTAEVTLECEKVGGVRLSLSYVIRGARWTPRYDARFDPRTSELTVIYFGEIRQKTGEDWKEAKLVLSTARPSVGASRPQLLPLRLTAVPGGKAGKEIVHTGREVDFEEFQRAFPDTTGAVPFRSTEVRESATAATFNVQGTATIPADGRPHKVPVMRFRERGRTSFETIPRLQRFVYLKCAARNNSPHPMLAGPVDIFRGSGFIGTSRLKFTAPGRPFEISLGIEESLKVRRAVTSNVRDGEEKREGFDIEVANFGEEPRMVTVIDNYPISDIEEVRVRLESSTTEPTEKNEMDGILKWQLRIPAGAKRMVHLEYMIIYPDWLKESSP